METHDQIQINNFVINQQSKKTVRGKQIGNNIKKSIYENYNLNKIGSIKYAKIHRSANRPLYKNKNKEFNKNTEFCQCCNLPAEQEGIMEKFNFWDDPDNFVECGEGISLYFTFFKFAMIIMIITFFLSSLYNIIFSKKYYDELYQICNGETKNLLFEEDCILYTEESKKMKSYSLISNSFFFMFNSINTKYYRNLYYNLTLNSNKNIENVIINTSFMNFICLITIFIFNIYFIIIINSKCQNINMEILSLSDYSIFLSHLRHILKLFLNKKIEIENKIINAEKTKMKYNYEEELYFKLGIDKSLIKSSELEQFISFLENKICVNEEGEKLKIRSFNICFKISELMELQNQVFKIQEKMSKIRNHPYQIARNEDLNLFGNNKKYFSSFLNLKCCEKSESLMTLKKQEKELKEEINELMKKSKENTLDYFAGCAIICVDTISEHENFLRENSNNIIILIFKFFGYIFCGCCISKHQKDLYWLRRSVRFERAPEPEDLIFENLEYANSIYRVIRIFLVYFFSFILIGMCFIIVTAFNNLQKYTDEKKDFHIVLAYIISLLISCFIQVINLIFGKILDFLTKKEKPSTTTNYYLSKSIKLTIFSFINQGVIPLVSELYIESNGYEYLIINILMIFLINSIVVPISWTISFSFIYKKFRIWLIERNINPDDPDANHGKTQRELNDLYELPSMDVAEKYSYICKTLLISFFYVQIFPLGIVISLFGFFLGYLLEKYNFCNIYRRPEMLNDELCKVYINNFIVCIFVSGIGDFIFKKDVYETKMWPLINIILFGILIIIPYHYIIDHFTKYCIDLKESKIHTHELKDKYYSFFNNYERANPMTKKEGITNYLNGLKTMGIIQESIFKKNIENLDNANLMKLYYNDRKHTNIVKAQKSINNKEIINKKTSILARSILFQSIKEEDFEEEGETYFNNDENNNKKDISNSNLILNNNINFNSDIKKENEPMTINVSSERKFNK